MNNLVVINANNKSQLYDHYERLAAQDSRNIQTIRDLSKDCGYRVLENLWMELKEIEAQLDGGLSIEKANPLFAYKLIVINMWIRIISGNEDFDILSFLKTYNIADFEDSNWFNTYNIATLSHWALIIRKIAQLEMSLAAMGSLNDTTQLKSLVWFLPELTLTEAEQFRLAKCIVKNIPYFKDVYLCTNSSFLLQGLWYYLNQPEMESSYKDVAMGSFEIQFVGSDLKLNVFKDVVIDNICSASSLSAFGYSYVTIPESWK